MTLVLNKMSGFHQTPSTTDLVVLLTLLLAVVLVGKILIAVLSCCCRRVKNYFTRWSVKRRQLADLAEEPDVMTPEDLLSLNACDPRDPVGNVIGPVPANFDVTLCTTHCRRVGRYVGMRIREEMGRPEYTRANKIVACQRIEAWRKDQLGPNFRAKYIPYFTEWALFYVFMPTKFERQNAHMLHTFEADRLRKKVQGRWDCSLPLLPVFIQRCLGTAVWVGVGFQ
jgi:hypothetical protein